MMCPCGSSQNLANCCDPYISSSQQPQTAEALMRSRYTAYATGNITYVKKTLALEAQSNFDFNASKKWADSSTWLGLKIVSAKKGGPEDKKGEVEFIATYSQNGQTFEHHEVSQFRKNQQGQWLFVNGDAHTHKEGESHNHNHHHEKPQTYVRENPKVGRNESCPCGSEKKYKKCCGK